MLTVSTLIAWGETGHKTIARIAAARLNGKARKNVARILGVSNSRAAVADAMAEGSFWPDAVARKLYPQATPWHFITLSRKDGAADQPDWFLRPNTVFVKLNQYAAALRARWPDELEAGSDLKFLLHFAGDIHQPLHAITNQDQGGNCIVLTDMFNLHSAWDSGLLTRHFGRDDRALAERLLKSAPKPEQPTANLRDWMRAWVMESWSIAKRDVYAPLTPPVPELPSRRIAGCAEAWPGLQAKTWTLAPSYIDHAGPVIEQRLTIAGLRLAALLNRLWK